MNKNLYKGLLAISLVASTLSISNVAAAQDKYEGVGPDDILIEEKNDNEFSVMMNAYHLYSGSFSMKSVISTPDVKLTNAASQFQVKNSNGPVTVQLRTAANGSYTPVSSKTFKKGTSSQYLNNTSSNHKKSAWVDYRIINQETAPVKGSFTIYDLR
ncbi:hypothetical protein MKY91_19630 [Alkalicoccobacillus gibsonii]|uniref:DUF5626 domain-containing protein n=1 Tax=Alkalicoccobacillus gibsonii TaxID=79881 RepID=A0ABU9VN97_9BACI